MEKFFDTLRRFNTGMTTLGWLWGGVTLLVPGLVAALYTLRDDLWQKYGSFGAAVVFLGAFALVGIGMAGMGYYIIARRPNEPTVGKAKTPSLPIRTLDLGELFKVASGNQVKDDEKDLGKALKLVRSSIYDALRSGHVACWGHESKFYPPYTTPPHEARVYIEPTFWASNTIEELDRIARGVVQDPGKTWASITMPDEKRFNREKTLCYWDLAFDPDDARYRWPNEGDWMV